MKQRTFENLKKYILYQCLIDGLHIQHYLRKAFPFEQKKNTANVRFSLHPMAIETGRYNKTDRKERNSFK